MKIIFKITSALLFSVREDLARQHEFAAERVGFLACRVAALKDGLVVLAQTYHEVADEDYLDDPSVGAMMGPSAIRKALQMAFNDRVSMFHVHIHDHHGRPWFSRIDLAENAKFVPDFWNVRPEIPHGALVLSLDSAAGLCWTPGAKKPTRIMEFTVVGAPMQFVRNEL